MSTLRTNTLQDVAGNNSVPLATVANGTAKAWVNFNGGNGALRGSFNVSGVTVLGGGNTRVTFLSALPDANYAVAATCSGPSYTHPTYAISNALDVAPTTTEVRLYSGDTGGAGSAGRFGNGTYMSVIIAR